MGNSFDRLFIFLSVGATTSEIVKGENAVFRKKTRQKTRLYITVAVEVITHDLKFTQKNPENKSLVKKPFVLFWVQRSKSLE